MRYLRFVAVAEELTLPIAEIAKRVLERSDEPPLKSKAAFPGH
jgi:hypothetical protein